MRRWLLAAVVGCVGKPDPSATETGSRAPLDSADTPTDTATATCDGYDIELVGTAVATHDPVADVPDVGCVLDEPTLETYCASDPEWAAAFGGACPREPDFVAAVQDGAVLGYNDMGWLWSFYVWDCVQADGTPWTVYRIDEACFDCSHLWVVFDEAEGLRGLSYDVGGGFYYETACCDGVAVEQAWIGEALPEDLDCGGEATLTLPDTADTGS